MAGIEDLIKDSGCAWETAGESRNCFGADQGMNIYVRLRGTEEQLMAALQGIRSVTPMQYADDMLARAFLEGSFKIVHCEYEGMNYYLGIMPRKDDNA